MKKYFSACAACAKTGFTNQKETYTYKPKIAPERADFGVPEKYMNKEIGSKHMDIAERIAVGYSNAVCLGAGLHSGYYRAPLRFYNADCDFALGIYGNSVFLYTVRIDF